jgi:hypothetical protein
VVDVDEGVDAHAHAVAAETVQQGVSVSAGGGKDEDGCVSTETGKRQDSTGPQT